MSRYLMAALLWSSAVFAQGAPPHLELDLTSEEYANRLAESHLDWRASELKEPLATGKRFLDWLVIVNKAREPQAQISLSSPDTMPAFPIESPRMLSEERITKAYDELKAEMPAWLKSALLEKGDLSATLPVADAEFVRWGLKVNGVYDNAARWTLLSPYLGMLAMRKDNDVRGYHQLTHEPDIEAKLRGWEDLEATAQEKYRGWLVALCQNGKQSASSCKETLEEAEGKKSGAVLELYKEALPAGKKRYDTFFDISTKRRDVTWSAQNPNLFSLPFKNPRKADVKSWLVDNIEDEWRWNGWNLKLSFKDSGFSTAQVVFEAGATPHVNGLAGSTITMDANVPLTEYAVKWTIRHEFGHVLGLPDCYHEFYDRDAGVLISYQIDISNLMCSRRGKLKEIHYNELKRAYYDAGDQH